MSDTRKPERIHTVVVGAGQAGLSVGYFLARRGVPFVILEAGARVGDNWRERWDSLRLFTPARFDGLAGMPFPAPSHAFPTKDEMADYLEAYAARFDLPVRTGVRVDRLWKENGRYMIAAGDLLFEAEHVVVAMATYQQPKIPHFAAELAPDIVQLHSRDYRNLAQLRPGGVLIVGAGNSGAEIAMETASAGRPTWLSGRDVGHVPVRLESAVARYVVAPLLFRVVFHRVLTTGTPVGRRARPHVISKGAPLIRQRPSDLRAAGVERVGRTTGARDGKPLLDDGRTLDVANVIWCTGFEPGLDWIDLPIFDDRGEPVHERGLVPSEPGIAFVGQHFLYALSSTMIHGVARDAEYVANAIAPPVPVPAPALPRHDRDERSPRAAEARR
ncbi:MAG TPA: NAD(P)-binding domain-containing protein [Gemmatimonadaceae bacterium]|nr:NAD(P)-binding domain-containing protein [Gemmatimonadaceae bacterium]